MFAVQLINILAFTATSAAGIHEGRNLAVDPGPNFSADQIIHLRQRILHPSRDAFKNVPESSASDEKKETIPILGLYELSSKKATGYQVSEEGLSEVLAAKLAIQHVNEANLLGKYELQLFVNDTKGDPGVAVDVFFHAILSRGIKTPVLLGTASSEPTASLANVAPHWNAVQISHGATSPVLQDRKAFPSFFRMVASDASHNSARLAFIQHFHWHVVSVFSQDSKEYTLTANNMVKMLEAANISCKGTITFAENDVELQLEQLQALDTRIIIGSFSDKVAQRLFCKVYDLSMYGVDYVWILPTEKKGHWWKIPGQCDPKIIERVLEGAIFIDSYQNYKISGTGFNSENLSKAMAENGLPTGRYARESYDSVWAAALAIKKVLDEQCKNTTRCEWGSQIFHALSETSFLGVSGPIVFQGSDRVGTSSLRQIQNGILEIVAIFSIENSILNFTCLECQALSWKSVPIAQRYLRLQIQTISSTVHTVVASATIIAIILAFLFLGFNIYFRKLKLIKLSSPRLNNIAVVGCVVVYIGVLLLGLDDARNPFPSKFKVLCAAKSYTFAGGFSLAFGSIFAKTYRIHKIFIRSRGGFVKKKTILSRKESKERNPRNTSEPRHGCAKRRMRTKKYLQDTQLILLVCVLLLIDGLVITTWTLVDPMDRHLRNLTLRASETDRSVMFMPQIEVCSCEYLHGWLSLIYVYKGVQLMMGVYMAWETRNVKIPVLNDSQYIGMSVYGVVITSCIVVVLANVVEERPSAAYVTISAMILTTTTATLGLLFFPKVITVLRRKDMLDPVMQSVGLKLESNTRRFPTNDFQEKLFRLEVQHRVYKREVLLLGAEIRRLEKQLLSPASPTISSSLTENATFRLSQDSESFEAVYETGKESSIVDKVRPRRSLPSERTDVLRLKDIPCFHSHQHLEEGSTKSRVFMRIRNLIRSKRIELKKLAEQCDVQTAEEPRRKFSLTMCLQAQRARESSRDIIIDFEMPPTEILTKRNHDRKFFRQQSFPIIFVTMAKAELSKGPTSLPELEQVLEKETQMAIRCRSFEKNRQDSI